MSSNSWIAYLGLQKKDDRTLAKDAIVELRQHLALLERKEAYLQAQIDVETKRARENAVSNQKVALAALRQRKAHETSLSNMSSARLTIDTQRMALENAALHQETFRAMKRAGEVLKALNRRLPVEDAEEVMEGIAEQIQYASEVSITMATPVGLDLDEDELLRELAELQQDQLDSRLLGTGAPSAVGLPTAPSNALASTDPISEYEDVQQLHALLAEMAM